MVGRNQWPGDSRFKGWFYLFPGLAIYLIFVLYPIFETIRTSFYQWDGFSANRVFIGIENYRNLLADGQFFKAISHNLIFLVFYSLIPILIGITLASLIGRKPLPGMAFFRTGLFLPQVLSMVVVGVMWRWIYNPAFGPLNLFLRSVGLDLLARSWLGDFKLALPAVGIVGSWVQYGFCMVLFIAGMQKIPQMLYEAAELDGAGSFQQMLHITLPGLHAEFSVAFITTVVAALRVFDLVFVTTRGGPGDETLVAAFLIYRSAFQQNQIGYAAAVATVLTVIIFLISFFILELQAKEES
ncbi:MAG: sugar ABC transporter permease [Anaerolineaceae bacterium]|nr:sugar ABC transporter permease [Anaerolineaceae bacterium]